MFTFVKYSIPCLRLSYRQRFRKQCISKIQFSRSRAVNFWSAELYRAKICTRGVWPALCACSAYATMAWQMTDALACISYMYVALTTATERWYAAVLASPHANRVETPPPPWHLVIAYSWSLFLLQNSPYTWWSVTGSLQLSVTYRPIQYR